MNLSLATLFAAKPMVIPELPPAPSANSGGGFAASLGSAMNDVSAAQQNAKSAAMDLLSGGKGDIHSVALATQRAELSMELFQQVRNKFVQAYQEIMKMPM